jgi:hypothetical protein
VANEENSHCLGGFSSFDQKLEPGSISFRVPGIMIGLVQENSRRSNCEAALTDQLPIQIEELLISHPVVFVCIRIDNDIYFLLDMPINLSIGIIGEDNVEIPDLSVKAFLEHSLTHRARVNRVDFEFQTVAVPLHIGVEYFRCAGEIVDVPQTDDAAVRARL